MTRAVALTALITLLLAGCGGGDGNASPDSAIDLTLTLWPNGEAGDSITWTLRCAPAGGDHPDPEAACAALTTANVALSGAGSAARPLRGDSRR